MDVIEACEVLMNSKTQLDYLVKLGKIAVQGEGEAVDYSEQVI